MKPSSPLPAIVPAIVLSVALLPARAADPARVDEIVQGKCFICHGVEGESSTPAFPRLAGQHADYVARQLADFKSGKRISSTMRPMVEDLSEDDFKSLGKYFETRKTRAHKVDDPELAQAGRIIFLRGNQYSGVTPCTDCHGPKGAGTAKLPRLAGQHAQYIESQLKAFNKRERTNDNAVMQGIAGKLTELEIKAVSAYVSGLE